MHRSVNTCEGGWEAAPPAGCDRHAGSPNLSRADHMTGADDRGIPVEVSHYQLGLGHTAADRGTNAARQDKEMSHSDRTSNARMNHQ